MARPYRSGKDVWSLRMRRKGVDELLSGYPTAKAAAKAAADFINALESKGRPVGLGPQATTLAVGLSDWGLQTLPFLKSAPQAARRINRCLGLAGQPLLMLEDARTGREREWPHLPDTPMSNGALTHLNKIEASLWEAAD